MQIPAAKFKAMCLELMDRVEATGETIVITKHDQPVALLVSVSRDEKRTHTGYGCMKGTILHLAPTEKLFSTGERWDALRAPD